MNQDFSFRLAKDGLMYDIDNIAGELSENEVEVIQFLRPSGKRRRMVAPVGKEAAEKAKSLILSAEMLMGGTLALYARKVGESEEGKRIGERMELAENGPGNNSSTNVLKRLIKRVAG